VIFQKKLQLWIHLLDGYVVFTSIGHVVFLEIIPKSNFCFCPNPRIMNHRRSSRKGSTSKVPAQDSISFTGEDDTSASASTTSTPPSSQYNYTPPLNLNVVAKPFKNPHYKTPKKFKNLKQIIAAEKAQAIPLDIPTYTNIEAPPSLHPQKKYCDITGLEGKYVDPKTRLRYHSSEIYREIKQMPPGVVQDYLGLRHAAVVLR